MKPVVRAKKNSAFDSDTFLSTIGDGRKILSVAKKQVIFVQGDEADAIFYVQKGKVRLTVVSQAGKEATIGVVSEANVFWRGFAGRSALEDGIRSGDNQLRDPTG
jgi:CRP/FNR family cyclic AMP-dependent transcriptional regulator